MNALILPIALSITLIACGASNGDLQTRLDTRAKFDLNCPTIVLVPLETDLGLTRSYGVTGCGRRATYVLGNGNHDWYMNSSDGNAVGQVPDSKPHIPAQ